MRNRIIEIAQHPAKLRIERRHLLITLPDAGITRVPLADIAAIVVAHPQVSYTQAVLSELTDAGGVFVTCDQSRMPNGILIPFSGNSIQTERFQRQLEMTRPQRKRIWQQLIKLKIQGQGNVLQEQTGSDHGLKALAETVQSGDPKNVEATAARRYWRALFGQSFRRAHQTPGRNACLDYGYAVLRAVVARAICSSGLHPSIGIHHHNRYNAFCLADDLMEPLRPLVDQRVCLISRKHQDDSLTQAKRAQLIEVLRTHLSVQGRDLSLFDSLTTTTASLARVADGAARKITLFDSWTHSNAAA